MFNFIFNPWVIALVSGASLVAWLIPQMQARQVGKPAPELETAQLKMFETLGFGGILFLAVVLCAPLPAVKGVPFDVGNIIFGITIATGAWWLLHLIWQKTLNDGAARWWGRGGMAGLPVAGGLLLFKWLLVDRLSHFDFGALLAGLLVVIIALMAIGKFLGDKIKGDYGHGVTTSDHPAVEFAKSLFSVVLIVLVLRQFIVEPFRIPSGSMMPTLLNGDFILVNKFAYGLRLPVTETKIIPVGKPKRGDVAVFRYPEAPETDFIKRIVGIPGDEIEYRNKQLFLNGEKVPTAFTGQYTGPQYRFENSQFAEQGIEQLPGKHHKLMKYPQARESLTRRSWTVPEGQYFVMGDNRDNSRDSRYWGFVPEKNLAGKAFFIWMNFDPEVGKPLTSRIFSKIQ